MVPTHSAALLPTRRPRGSASIAGQNMSDQALTKLNSASSTCVGVGCSPQSKDNQHNGTQNMSDQALTQLKAPRPPAQTVGRSPQSKVGQDNAIQDTCDWAMTNLNREWQICADDS